MWLPIDSKFPKEDFELLINAYDSGTPEQIEECRKSFVRGIKKSAMEICGKYIDPPNTTTFCNTLYILKVLWSLISVISIKIKKNVK